MTVTAIDSKPAGVMLVTEGNRLLDGNVDARGVRRPVDRVQSPAKADDDKSHRDKNQSCKRVAAWLKYLRHTGTEAEELRLDSQGHVIHSRII